MSASSPRMLAIGILALAALTAPLTACDDSAPQQRKEQEPKPSLVPDVSVDPVWTIPVTGKRYCPEYSAEHKAILDAGTSDVTMRDAITGQTKWTYKKKGLSCPVATKEAVYIAVGEGGIIGLDPLTGKEKWAIESTLSFGNVDGEAPVVTSFDVHALFAGDLMSADKSLKSEIWHHEEQADMWIEAIAAYDTTLILATHNGKVRALNGKDGKVLWTYNTPSFGLIDGEFAISDGVVYFGSEDGSVYALDLATGKKIWNTKLSDIGQTWSPKIAGSMLITADETYIHGLNRKTGKKIWKEAERHWRLVTTADQALYAQEGIAVTSLDADTGKENWIIVPISDGRFLAASPTHVYVRTEKEIQAYKLTTREAD